MDHNTKYILMATDEKIAEAFRNTFADNEHVIIYEGFFEDLQDLDCLVSPANSFGLMDGGMDAAITQYFGSQLPKRVQQHIIEEYAGEQPVGTSFVIETNHPLIKYLAHSPTMRVPSRIKQTDNVYRATKATLLAVRQSQHPIESVALPAFGAGVGGVLSENVANQMALAFQHVFNPPQKINWQFAYNRNLEIEEVVKVAKKITRKIK